MKVIKANLYLDKYKDHEKALKLLKQYSKCTGFNQSQSIIQLILHNEEYINSLCLDEKPGELHEVGECGSKPEERMDMPDFIREYEESDRVDIFGEQGADG